MNILDWLPRLLGAGRYAMPAIVSLLLLLFSLLPWGGGVGVEIKPSFLLVSIYYWVLHFPALMPVWVVFSLGVAHDLIGLSPLGVGTLCFVTTYILTGSLRQHLVQAPMPMMFGGLVLVSAMARLAGWLINLIVSETVSFDMRPAIFAFLLDLATFVPLAYLFARLERVILPESK